MLEAKTAKVDLAQGLPGNAPSPMGSEVKLDDAECPGIRSLCVLYLTGDTAGKALGSRQKCFAWRRWSDNTVTEKRPRREAQKQGFAQSVGGSRMSQGRALLLHTDRV